MRLSLQKRIFLVIGLVLISGGKRELRCFEGKPSLPTYEAEFTSNWVGWARQLHLEDEKKRFDATVSLSTEYSRTFRSRKIAELLFRSKDVTVSGSAVPDRDIHHDVLADYLGLPRDFKSHLHFSPVVTDFIVNIDALLGMDNVVEGLFFGVHMPIKETKWDLKMQECVINTGTAFHPAGYMGPEQISRDKLAPNAHMAMLGQTIAPADSPMAGQVVPLIYGDVQEPLAKGLFLGRAEKAGIADLKFTAGWTKKYDTYHVGWLLVTRVPTGNRRNGIIYFQPIVGNGKHWELGGGFTFHYDFFKRDNGARSLGLYFDSVFSTVFPAWEKRCFNFNGLGLASKYMLMQEIANGTYVGRLVPAINYTTMDARIGVTLKADITAKLLYIRDSINLEMGYNFSANTRDSLKDHACFPVGRYALKGDAQVYGFDGNSPVPLQATQHRSFLNRGQTSPTTGDVINNTSYQALNYTKTAFQNLNADNLQLTPYNQLNSTDAGDLNLTQKSIYTSHPPIILQACDIDYTGVLYEKCISHRFFVHVSKLFADKEPARVKPSLGAGFYVQVAGTKTGKNSDFSKWGVNIGGSLFW